MKYEIVQMFERSLHTGESWNRLYRYVVEALRETFGLRLGFDAYWSLIWSRLGVTPYPVMPYQDWMKEPSV